MLSLKANLRNTADIKKIQHFADQVGARILVGFPSGRQHADTWHKNEDGDYETIDHGDPAQEQPLDTDELAKILSYGSGDIPPRPFLEEGIESKKDELRAEIITQAQKVKDGQSANWNKVGTMAVGAIQEFVRSDYYKTRVPNADRTIEYKGSDTPLIDGGDLVNATTYIIDGGEK